MKIRCGSHQQNRSIVRPGLSLMAAKVALTAEEFRENSQRSIALFNTEKLSTDSTHVLKSAYCILCISAVAICTGHVEAKDIPLRLAAIDPVAICTGHVEAKRFQPSSGGVKSVAICTGHVEAKRMATESRLTPLVLQSARGMWRQRRRLRRRRSTTALQSARGMWRQRGLAE